MNGVFVDISVVLTQAESSIFLFDKEEGRCLGKVGWADFPRSKVFIEEILGSLVLVQG